MVHRKDLNEISPKERQNLVELMLNYITDSVVEDHMDIIHSGIDLFTGHRAYIAGMEEYLLANGGTKFTPLPMWNPAKPIPKEFNVVKADDNGRDRPPLRNLNPNRPLPSRYEYPEVCNFLSADELGNSIDGWHGSVHLAIDGTMGDAMIAPAAPIFWCWHAFLDHVYYDWQFCQVIVPQSKGIRLEMARLRINKSGLKVGNITRIPSSIVRPEVITFSQEPIDPLLVEPRTSMMSHNSKRNEAAGDNAIFGQNIQSGLSHKFRRLTSGPRVVGQSPSAGTVTSHGSTVDLTVISEE